MPLYFMHLIDSTDVLLDPTRWSCTLKRCRGRHYGPLATSWPRDVMRGRLDLGYRIEVQDESGELVLRLEFGDALQIDGARRKSPSNAQPTPSAV